VGFKVGLPNKTQCVFWAGTVHGGLKHSIRCCIHRVNRVSSHSGCAAIYDDSTINIVVIIIIFIILLLLLLLLLLF